MEKASIHSLILVSINFFFLMFSRVVAVLPNDAHPWSLLTKKPQILFKDEIWTSGNGR